MALPVPSETSTALITGASSGIGEAIARRVAERGHGVTLVARREERLRTLADELAERHGIRAETIAADLGSAAARDEVAARIAELGLTVEIVVNNAGFGGSGGRERLVAMAELNCVAVLDFQSRYTPGMVERGQGAVINIASTASFQPLPGSATYAATKAFVLSLSEASHEDLKGSGVTVTAICPGPVKTEFMDVAGLDGAEGNVPDIFWSSADEVGDAAVEAAEKGKRAVVVGLLNRAGAITGQHVPRSLVLPLAKRLWRQAI